MTDVEANEFDCKITHPFYQECGRDECDECDECDVVDVVEPNKELDAVTALDRALAVDYRERVVAAFRDMLGKASVTLFEVSQALSRESVGSYLGDITLGDVLARARKAATGPRQTRTPPSVAAEQRELILSAVQDAGGEWVTGEAVAAELGLDKKVVYNRAEVLASRGEIEKVGSPKTLRLRDARNDQDKKKAKQGKKSK